MNALQLLLAACLSLQPQPAAAPQQLKADNPATIPIARTDNAWVVRNDAFNARAVQGHEKGDIDIIFLGDSITQGWEGAGHDIWEKRYAPRHAVNFGIGGDRTQHVLYRIEHGNFEGLDKPLAGSPPKLVVLMIGTNNTGSDSAEQIAGGVKAVLTDLHAKLPGTPVLLLAVFPRGERPTDPFRVKVNEINERIRHFTDDRLVTYLDLGPAFLAASAKSIPPDSVAIPFAELVAWLNAGEQIALDKDTAAVMGHVDSKTPLTGKGVARAMPDNSFTAAVVSVDNHAHVLLAAETIRGTTKFLLAESGEFEKILSGGGQPAKMTEADETLLKSARQRLYAEYRAQLLSKQIMPDMLHLSPEGYQVWADTMEPVLAKLLGE